jgi:hypothetical protein
MPREPREEGPRVASGGRSDLLQGQLRRFTEQVAASGKAAELFELEMWLRSFERFFRVGARPLSERESRALASRDWSEELRLVDNAIVRVLQLANSILTEDRLDLDRFDRYVESSLAAEEGLDPYIEKLVRSATPETALTLLRESFENLHLVLLDLVKLSRLPYPTFQAVGQIVYREVRRSDLLAALVDRKWKPVHDRIRNRAVVRVIRGIPEPGERRQAAKVFLELFRLLHYLDYADPARLPEEQLRDTILVFALVVSETRLLLNYVEKRVLKGRDATQPLYLVYDSFVYCIPLELRKVVSTELTEISAARHVESVRSRVENSHGILKDCFQQSIVQLAQALDPAIDGSRIFPDFTARREQSIRLRDALAAAVEALREFQRRPDEAAAARMRERVSDFYDHHIKYLMYRDWSGFELFYIEVLKCTSLTALQQIAHRFETFLVTLLREVQKRSLLQGAPDRPAVRAILGS